MSDSYFEHLNTCDNDSEVLARLLKLAIPELDEIRFARIVEREFNGLNALLAARYSKIKEKCELSDHGAIFLKYVQSIVLRTFKSALKQKNLNSCISELYSYLILKSAYLDDECLFLLLLNSNNYLIKEEIVATGAPNFVLSHPALIIKKIMDASATSIILVHNHPGGNPRPSKTDIDSTIELDDICRALSITFHDHLIVTESHILSMKQEKYF